MLIYTYILYSVTVSVIQLSDDTYASLLSVMTDIQYLKVIQSVFLTNLMLSKNTYGRNTQSPNLSFLTFFRALSLKLLIEFLLCYSVLHGTQNLNLSTY